MQRRGAGRAVVAIVALPIRTVAPSSIHRLIVETKTERKRERASARANG